MSKATFEKEEQGIYFYTVESEYDLHSPVLFKNGNKYYLGTTGDIYTMQESMLDIVPFSQELITYFVGGHAGLLYNQYNIIETTGLNTSAEGNCVTTNYNNTLYNSDRSVIGLRVKAPLEDIYKAVEFAYNQLHKPYNYTFLFNRANSFYCTDLVQRSFSKEAGLNYNLDKDGIAVSIQDLIVSDDTFIIYYKHIVDGVTHLYYSI